MDYDRYSDTLPVLGTAAAVAMDGSHFTPAIDTAAYGWKSLTFLANISGAVQYGAVSWQLQDSDDNLSFDAVDASNVLFTLPKDPTTTSKVFHAGYIGKRRYLKCAFTSGGAETGQITALLGHGMSQPVWQNAYADMVEGGLNHEIRQSPCRRRLARGADPHRETHRHRGRPARAPAT